MKSNRSIRSAGRWTRYALLTVATLVITIAAACSSEEPTPPAETRQIENKLLESIERLNTEVAALRRTVDETRGTENGRTEPDGETDPDEPQAAATPAPAQQGTLIRTPEGREGETEPTMQEPQAVVIPTPAGPGICGRSPEMQEALLRTLEVNLCQTVSTGELFRITHISSSSRELRMKTAKRGDFTGLVNLEGLSLIATNVEADALAGMDSLEKMSLEISSEGTMAKGSLRGLPSLRVLHVKVAANAKVEAGAFQGLTRLETLTVEPHTWSDDPTFTVPDLRGMQNLKQIRIWWHEKGYEGTAPFDGLPNLESAEIGVVFQDADLRGREPRLSPDMFKKNTQLKTIVLGVGAAEKARVQIPEAIFQKNPALEEIEISSENVRVAEGTFSHLERLKKVTLPNYTDQEGERKKQEIKLHESSPLYTLITVGGQRPSGYELVED